MFNAAIDGKLKSLWIIGEDVVQTDPNTQKVKKALASLDMLVVQEYYDRNENGGRSATRCFLSGKSGITNGERRIQKVQKVVEPIEATKTDGQIIIDVMNRMGYEQPDYTPDGVLKEISEIVPFFAGVTWDA